MTAVRFVRVTLVCEYYGNKNYEEHRAWSFWFDVIVNEKNWPIVDVDGYYFGGHQTNGSTQFANEETYPARLDPRTGEIYVLFDSGESLYYRGVTNLLSHKIEKKQTINLMDSEGGCVSIYKITDVAEAADMRIGSND